MSRTQKAIAAVVGADKPIFVDVPRPEAPAEDKVLCRTLQLGICGTDREILASKKPWVPNGEKFLVLGHECLARVQAVGRAVTSLKQGDLVVPTVRRPLRPSNIRIDMLSFGDYTERGIVKQHGFSQEHWVESPEYLLPVEESLADIAVFTEPQSVAEKAVNEAAILQAARLGQRAWVESPPRVLVTGQGPIAFAALIAGVSRTWPVTMMGRDRGDTFRIGLAIRLGTQEYIPLSEADLSPKDFDNDGFDLLLECTGSEEVLLSASAALAPRGVAVWLGAARDPVPKTCNFQGLMRNAVLRNHIHLGSVNAAPRDFADALEHLRAIRELRPDAVREMLTSQTSVADALSAFRCRESQAVKTVVQF